MLKYILTYNDDSIELRGIDSPSNVDGFTMAFTRDERFGTVLRSYTISEKFTLTGKTWIKNIIDRYGWSAEIDAEVLMWDAAQFRYITVIENGRINLAKFIENETTIEVNIEQGSFQSKILNRIDNEVNIKSNVAFDGTYLSGYTLNVENIVLYDALGEEHIIKGVRLWRVFEFLIRIITGENEPLDADKNDFIKNDLRFITTGKLIRGYDSAEITVSMQDLFDTINAQSCIGMGFDGNKVYFDRLKTFYPTAITAEINNIQDLEYTFDTDALWTKLIIGYSNFNKKENKYGQSEWNVKSTYTNGIAHFNKTKNIVAKYRADGTAIETLRELGATEKSDPLDNEIFILDCLYNEDERLVNRRTDGLTSFSGIFNNYTLFTNMLLSPARMLKAWGAFVGIPFKYNTSQPLTIQQTETLTTLATKRNDETEEVIDGVNVEAVTLESPFLSGRIIKFNCEFDAQTLVLISDNPNGLIKYYDNINKLTNFGFIKEIQIQPIDKTHKVELYELGNVEIVEDADFILNENDSFILDEIGEKILIEY
jgi:hypothetical protein